MESLINLKEGLKCSVFILEKGNFVRRNGIVKNQVRHKPGAWCIQLITFPYSFVIAYEKNYEIIEPMNDYEEVVNAFDEL